MFRCISEFAVCERRLNPATTQAACLPCRFVARWRAGFASPHDCHADMQKSAAVLVPGKSEMPALRIGDQKVAEYLDARHRLELFRIDEEGVDRDRVGF